jgi:hypothetical protein
MSRSPSRNRPARPNASRMPPLPFWRGTSTRPRTPPTCRPGAHRARYDRELFCHGSRSSPAIAASSTASSPVEETKSGTCRSRGCCAPSLSAGGNVSDTVGLLLRRGERAQLPHRVDQRLRGHRLRRQRVRAVHAAGKCEGRRGKSGLCRLRPQKFDVVLDRGLDALSAPWRRLAARALSRSAAGFSTRSTSPVSMLRTVTAAPLPPDVRHGWNCARRLPPVEDAARLPRLTRGLPSGLPITSSSRLAGPPKPSPCCNERAPGRYTTTGHGHHGPNPTRSPERSAGRTARTGRRRAPPHAPNAGANACAGRRSPRRSS